MSRGGNEMSIDQRAMQIIDKAQTHAARRVLAKRGIDWRTDR